MSYAQPLEPQMGDKLELSGPNNINVPKYTGALALFFPKQYHEPKSWSAQYPDPVAAVTADVVILDRFKQDGQPEYYQDTMLFGRVMVGQLKANMNVGGTTTKVLGRLKQEARGKGLAWVIGEWVPGDDATAQQWEASHPRNLGYAAAGAPPQAQQAPPAWGQQPPPQASPPAPQQWGGAPQQPPAAPPQQATWSPPVATPAPVDHTVNYPTGLKEFLVSKGVNDFSTLDVQAAIALAGTFG